MKNPILPLWENPEIQEINRLPTRSSLLPFRSEKEALADAIAGPEFRKPELNLFFQSLDGDWRFRLLENPSDDLPPEGDNYTPGHKREGSGLASWVSPAYAVSAKENEGWTSIKVPGAWSRQGGGSIDGHPNYENCFDKPHYTNVQMPYQALPPDAPEKNPTGLYRRAFTIPAEWKGRRIVLHVGSAESVSLVYVNGIFAGAGKDTRLPSEYDLTPFLKEGENLLCIKVVRYSDASYVEDQDQWWFGGIHRSVFLYSTGESYLKDIKAVPGSFAFEEGKLKGRLDLSVTVGGKVPAARSTGNDSVTLNEGETPFVIKYNLYPFSFPKNRKAAERFAEELNNTSPLVSGSVELFCNYRRNANTGFAGLVLDEPEIWSHEHPNLYLLSVSLYRDGVHLESAAFTTGFRNLEVKGRELLINGKAVLIKGVNRHEHDEKTGKTISTESMVRDIRLLKEYNFNAVRTSHYPNDERWYELCDRYGIYLIDEANVESHCFYDQLCKDSRWTYAFISRMRRMTERDKLHPAIILWSLGNESGWGASHDAGAAWIRAYDPSRPLIYEGAIRPKERGQGSANLDSLCQGKNVSDIVGPMYPRIELITDFVKYREDERPLIMIEYSHAMGNSNGSLADYWKAIENHHGLQGGFIWEWKDHGLEAYTPDGRKYWKYGGDFGDEPSDFDFCVDGLILPDQTVKPGMDECKQVFAPARLTPVPEKPFGFILENRYDFSGLDGLKLDWKLCADVPGGDEKIIREGLFSLPDLKPGEKTEIVLFSGMPDLSVYSGTVYIRAGFVLTKERPPVKKGHVIARAERVLREALPPEIVVSGAGKSPESDEKKLDEFAALFGPSLFRVPTQNDGLKTSLSMMKDPAAKFYFREKAMLYWLDLDLLHIRTAGEKTGECLYEGFRAKRFSASLLAGPGARGEFRDRVLGTYTAITTVPEAGKSGIIMDILFDLDPGLPELPKVGITAKIPAVYGEISWFGRGPGESYPDRLAAAFLGRYRHSVAELEVPYVMPQENGNRSGIRNFSLIRRDAGKEETITVTAEKPVNFSASRYSPENLWEARHTHDLVDLTGPDGGKNGGCYFLNIDIIQRGVGTATCGPDTRPEYRVRPGLYRVKLYIESTTPPQARTFGPAEY